MMAELIAKVEQLEHKLDGHMLDEECAIQEAVESSKQANDKSDKNAEKIDQLHEKMDTLLNFADVWSNLQGFSKVCAQTGNFIKWCAAIFAAVAAAFAAVKNWPGS